MCLADVMLVRVIADNPHRLRLTQAETEMPVWPLLCVAMHAATVAMFDCAGLH